jgi:hypothetical protein
MVYLVKNNLGRMARDHTQAKDEVAGFQTSV